MEKTDLGTKEGFEKYLQYHLDMCREMFKQQGYIAPFAVLLVQRDQGGNKLPEVSPMIISLSHFGGSEINLAFRNFMREMSPKLEAVGVLFTSEAWAATAEGDRSVPPSKRLDRREVVIIQAEHVAIEHSFGCTIEIHRKGDQAWLDEKTERNDLGPGTNLWDLLGRKKGN